MWSRMRPEFYISKTHYQREMQNIFSKLWIFAGLKSSLKTNNQILTTKIANTPVVLQNLDGQIVASVNCSAHRALHTKCIGELVFVNFAIDPISIYHQFHPGLIASLLDLSRVLDSEFIASKRKGSYNWKLPFENLNDSLHPFFVHAKTLSREVDFEGQGFDCPDILRLASAELKELSYFEPSGTFKRERHEPFYDFVHRFGDQDIYYNWLLYPNTHIASPDGGRSFVIEQYNPIAPDQTELAMTWLTARKKSPYPFSAAVLWSLMKGCRTILDEDEDILEKTQSGFCTFSPAGAQGAYEIQNKRIEAWYSKWMDTQGDS
jgi:carnitine monooxygenase subunit